jgi:amidase
VDGDDLTFAGALRQAELVRSGEVSSLELTEMYLARIERLDPGLNAYRDVFADAARDQARSADERRAAGEEAPLLGVPIAIKDTIDLRGDVTKLGTDGFDQPAVRDSELVRRLRQAGAVILGKTNLPELAIHGYTESKTFGVTRNPWDPERTTGGSSGGSAAAVAAGLCAIAHASDGAGSIRYPAAHCGLFGLKPQRNRVPIESEHWYGLSVNGCISRSVADTALFLDAVVEGPATAAGPPPPAPERSFAESAASNPGRLRVAVSTKAPRAVAPPLLGDESRQAVERIAGVLRRLGHDVEWRDPSWGGVGNQIMAAYVGGIAADVDAVPHPDRLESLTRGYRRLARVAASGWAIRRARRLEEGERRRINRIFDHHDVLLMPLTAGPAFEHGRFHRRGTLSCLLGQSRFYPYAVTWNYTGQPAASVPAGLTEEGLPIAVQLVGRPNDEATLLSLSAQLESELRWPERRPPLSELQPA